MPPPTKLPDPRAATVSRAIAALVTSRCPYQYPAEVKEWTEDRQRQLRILRARLDRLKNNQ